MTKLNVFNGGLNTRLAPHLIKVNEAVQYSNIDNEDGTLKAVHDKAEAGLTLSPYAYYFEAQAAWVSSSTVRNYIEYRDTLYYSEPASVPKYWDGTTEYLLGIKEPSAAPTVAVGAAGVLTGTYTYVVTYYNSTKGVESQPSAVSAEVTPSSQSIDITSIPVSSDAQVDQKRIYRVGGVLASFSLVATIPNATTSYNDDLADTAIPGNDMAATDYDQAPTGLDFLTEAYGIMFGAVGDRLYYSLVGQFTYWPASYFIDFPTNITAIMALPIGILVATKYRTYLVSGTSRATFTKKTFDTTQGCLTFQSVQYVNNSAIWVSSDGLCTAEGARVKVITRERLGKLNLAVVNSAFHDDTYYALKADNTILAYDFRYGVAIKNLDVTATRLVVGNDKLYGYEGSEYLELFQGIKQISMAYKSPRLVDGSKTQRKVYKSVFIDSVGTLTIDIYVSDKLVLSKAIDNSGVTELKIPENSTNGYSMQFGISGIGEVYELDYTVKGNPK